MALIVVGSLELSFGLPEHKCLKTIVIAAALSLFLSPSSMDKT